VFAGERLSNQRDLLRRLAFAVDYLRETAAQRPVVIERRESQVLVRQVLQSCERIVDGNSAVT